MRFHFSIRDLLWLTLVVALVLGWWFDHSRQSKRWFVYSERNGQIVIENSPDGQVLRRAPGGTIMGHDLQWEDMR